MLSTMHSDGPAFNTRSRMAQQSPSEDSTPQTDAIALDVTDAQSFTPKSLSADRLEVLLQMQKTDPFCTCISKQLSNGKAPNHKADLFIHVKGLHRLTPKILGSCDPKGMEVHSISGST